MLITCPECEGQVSSVATCCPHCGFPLTRQKKAKKSKRMRLPNGFGRIVEIKGKNLRKPYRAMVTIGKDECGHPIGKILKPEGYFATYNEAYKALIEYHTSPYDFDNNVTLEEVYERWYEGYSKKVGSSRLKHIKSAWLYMSIFHQTKIQTIKQKMVRNIIEESYKIGKDGEKQYPPDSTKKVIKQILVEVMNYAVENEIIDKNYAKDVKVELSNEVQNPHESFTSEEINLITKLAKTNITAQMILVQCYTGLRPNELCSIEVCKINMTDWFFICGSKTDAGRDRMIPIHVKIRDLIQEKYNYAISNGCEFLFNTDHGRILYQSYHEHFKEIFPEHRPHDPRKHFVTIAKKVSMDEYAIKRIVGHKISDITEAVYTDRDIGWLHEELSKIRSI